MQRTGGTVPSLERLIGRSQGAIPEVFRARAELTPDATFLIWDGRRYSYAAALKIIEATARGIQSVGAGRPMRLVTYLHNRPEALWAWLGCAFAGATLVALNRNHRGAILQDQLSRSLGDVLVTDAEGAELDDLEANFGGRMISLAATDAPLDVFEAEFGRSPDAPMPGPSPAPGDIAAIMFTSSTTGRSKAVRIPHGQYVRGAARVVDAFELGPQDVFHNWLPLFHLGGQLHMTMTAVICGGAVALFPRFSRSSFREEIESTRASVLCGFASILNVIWSIPPRDDDHMSSLRAGIFAGIPPELHEPFERRFGMRLAENYGMTEADPITLPRADRPAPTGSCGFPTDDFEVTIFDERDLPAPAGAVGQIVVRARAANVMSSGYEGDDEATASAWRGGWFHTGDMGLIDQHGALFFSGRSFSYIRRRGENISAGELEAVFLGHPDIAECAVVGVPSELGEDDVKVVAVPKPGAKLEAPDIHAFAAERVARFMRPRYVEVVAALPRTDLGKVQISALKQNPPLIWDAERDLDP